MKKLRYASDFFGHLFASRRAKKRLPSFKARLTDLQDCLGALNDIKVHQKLAPKPAAGKPSAKAAARKPLPSVSCLAVNRARSSRF